MHPLNVIVWCDIWSEKVIGKNFFEDAVTVNTERYMEMLNEFFCRKLLHWTLVIIGFYRMKQPLTQLGQLWSIGTPISSSSGFPFWRFELAV